VSGRRVREPVGRAGAAVVAPVLVAVVLVGAVAAAAQAPKAHPQIAVGGFPTGIALNPETDTIYVANGTTHSLSLIDGKTCNAGNVKGCRQRVTAVTAGVDPIGVAVDPSTNTVYAVNGSGTVAVVDGRRCMAGNTAGCHVAPATVDVGVGSQFLVVDAATHTVYVANVYADRVLLIDGRTCNAASRAGCGKIRASVRVGPGPFAIALNHATRSIYVTNVRGRTVSVIDGRRCNAVDVSGCGRRPANVDVGKTPGGIAVNARTNTIYVTGESSNDISVIDGRACNARLTRGCRATPARAVAGAGARGIAVDERTNTVYVANTAANTVTVIDGATCNGAVHTGCGKRAAAAPVGVSPRRVAVDEVTDTVYVTNAGSNSVTMLNGRSCNGRVHSGCGRATTADRHVA
jgi:DNA-binding beta-propeller fold protein YncE